MRSPAVFPIVATVLVSLVTFSLGPPTANAQRRFVHDTMSRASPTGLVCGFCAGEKFGVIFRELPSPLRGLEPTDFPITFDTIEIAIADAGAVGGSCVPASGGGLILATVALYVGTTLPTGSILANPTDGPWPGETVVWDVDDVPLELSVAETDGSGRYEVSFNVLEIRDPLDDSIIEVSTGTYVRVAVTLPVGEPSMSDMCGAPLAPPGGFPLRDDDGRIADERNFILASGAGWFWSDSVPGGAINGDWGIRLQVFTNDTPPGDGGPRRDGGVADVDSGTAPSDAGAATDASASMDGGPGTDDGGCGCRVGASPRSGVSLWLAMTLAFVVALRRERVS